MDTVEGTAGNDTINAFAFTAAEVPATTLTTNDSIDGGAGVDTLNLYATEDFNRDLNGSVANVEKINIFGSDFIGTTLTAVQLQAIEDAQEDVTDAEAAVAAAELAVADAEAAVTAAEDELAAAEANELAVDNAGILINAAVGVLVDAGTDAEDYNNVLTAVNAVNADAATKAAVIAALGANGAADLPALITVVGTAVTAQNTAAASAVTTAGTALTTAEGELATAEGELATAETALENALDAANASNVDASYFEGSTDITVDGVTTGVTEVDGQVVTMTGANVNNAVSYADDVASGSIVLASRGTVTVEGADLATLSVSGSIKAVDAETDGVLTLVDNTEDGTVETLNLALTNNGIVNVNGMDALTDVVSTGAGDLTLVSDASVQNVTTAGGDDEVTISTVTDADEEINASVSTGAGDDVIYVATSGDGTTTVDAGAGDDLVFMTRALNDNDSLSGGAGVDTLSIVNLDTDNDEFDDPEEITAGTIARLAETAGFENLQFQNSVIIDASEVSNFSELQLAGEDNDVTEADEDQTIVLQYSWGYNDIAAAGFDGDADSAAAAIADAGNLTIRAEEDQEQVRLYGDEATLTVDASEADEEYDVEIEDGVLNSLTVNLISALNDDGDGVEGEASVDISAGAFDELSSIVINGQGYASVNSYPDDLEGSLTVDASGMVALLVNEGEEDEYNATEFEFYGDDVIQENIIVGEGSVDTLHIDSVIGNAQLSKVDTIEGLSFELNEAGTGYAEGSDRLIFNQENGEEFVGFEFTTVPSSLAAAVNTVSALTDDNVVFQFGGATYIFSEDTDGVSVDGDFEATDVLIKLVGTYELDQIVDVANLNMN